MVVVWVGASRIVKGVLGERLAVRERGRGERGAMWVMGEGAATAATGALRRASSRLNLSSSAPRRAFNPALCSRSSCSWDRRTSFSSSSDRAG